MVDENDERLESPAGFVGFAPELEDIEQEIAQPLAIGPLRFEDKCPAVGPCSKAGLQTGIKLLDRYRLHCGGDVQVGEDSMSNPSALRSSSLVLPMVIASKASLPLEYSCHGDSAIDLPLGSKEAHASHRQDKCGAYDPSG